MSAYVASAVLSRAWIEHAGGTVTLTTHEAPGDTYIIMATESQDASAFAITVAT
jgi:hypothetical protein